ncbi:MAG: methyltransferase domain-containing protein [Xanthobacteraceae bacterium]
MSAAPSGPYPLERREGEIERLVIQGAAMAPDCAIMLERIGVAEGWHCLDLGCGPGGITPLLTARVGASGRVVGLDADPVFLDFARAKAGGKVEFVHGDAYRTDLPDASFDLVHTRFIASTAGRPEALLGEAMRLTRPGGVVTMQEPDMAALTCFPPRLSWGRLRSALVGAFASTGADINLGQRLFALARAVGLSDVQYRPFLVGVRSGDPMADYLPSTVESLRSTIVGRGLMSADDLDATIADCRAHLAKPDTCFTTYAVVQVWGRTPA